MYCPNCKQNFEDGIACPNCLDGNGNPMELAHSSHSDSDYEDALDTNLGKDQIIEDNGAVEVINIDAETAVVVAEVETAPIADTEEVVEVTTKTATVVTNAECDDSIIKSDDVETKNTELDPQGNVELFLKEVQQHIYEQMGLKPEWMSKIDSFSASKSDGSCEEGYRLSYEDQRKLFGRKLWIEVDKSGTVTRVITTK